MTELDNAYQPKGIEEKWYAAWLERGYFSADAAGDRPYSIVIPPPNVTGSLHMGHALNATIQDILSRWKRMSGCRVLWLPGTDHAGIATQNVVEREIAKEGLNRHVLGREAFIGRVWHWKKEYGGRIIHQLKRLGASCDWKRERFTLDEGLSKAVREVFVRLYEDGMIYRDNRLINWCPRCHTALSDLEVEHEDVDGMLTYIKYPLTDGSGELIVATTRPETMLGDTAVAVNPEDERYGVYIGKTVRLPLADRDIPVIADSAVELDFGTGAVKVTPAHDFNDEAMARRQDPVLPFVTVIDDRGRMTSDAGAAYAGLDRHECRRRVVEDLSGRGLIDREERHRHSVGHCYRCKTVIEPLSTPQWYVRVSPLAEKAIAAVRDGRIRIIPEGWQNSYFAWMENIRDWCISRQIWWGHRIPVWYCKEMSTDLCRDRKGVVVALETPRTCPHCGSGGLVQDEDVLDTWFSSALWPFSTLGWPDDTEDLRTFYPTSVLVTAFDILFFWVARMIMMGLRFMDDVPFRDVYIHAIVRDSKGEKMSKSKGNVVDPLIMIEQYGADAFRFSLAAFAAQGRDIRFSEDRVEGYRFFVNKLWNAARFVLMHAKAGAGWAQAEPASDLPSRWILSRLAAASDEVNAALSEYRLNDAASAVYQFLWHEFCDWYIEMAKEPLYGGGEDKDGTVACLLEVLDGSLRLLHPFMPFVTEEIWQAVRQRRNSPEPSIVVSRFPAGLERDPFAEREMSFVTEAVSGIRSVRGEMNIPPSLEVRALLKVSSDEAATVLGQNILLIRRLSRASGIEIGADLERPRGSATAVKGFGEIYIPLEGLLDVRAEIERLSRERRKVEDSLGLIKRKLGNEDFLKRAPQEVVEKEKEKYGELTQKEERLRESINRLRELGVET